MRFLQIAILLSGLLAVICPIRPVTAGEQRIVLKEHVNRRWTNELLSYPFEAPQGACHAGSVSLQGPQGRQPVQLSDVEYWPESQTVKSATLWLVADLPPLETNVYMVRYAAKPSDVARAPGDLHVKATDDQVEMVTSHFGVRLRLGDDSCDPPQEAVQCPGPLTEMRSADGTRFGGSRLFGDAKLLSWSGRLVAAGPVFAQVDYIYRYEDGNRAVLTATLHDGSAALYWETSSSEDHPEDGVDFVISDGLPPLTLVAQREAYGDRPQMEKASWGTWVEIPLEPFREELVTQLSPWADWWSTWTQTTVRLSIGQSGRELQIASHDPGRWVDPEQPGTVRDWTAWQHKLIPLRCGSDGEVLVRLNNAAGRRKWSIEDRDPSYAETRRMSLAQVKAHWPPLNEVKDWVLQWPDDGRKHPHLFISPDDVQAAWRRTQVDEDALRQADYLSREEIRPVPSYKDAQAIEVYLRTNGDSEACEKVRLVQRMRQHMGALGNFDKMRGTQTVAALYDLMLGTDLVDDADTQLYRSQMAMLGYILASPSTWDIERGYRSYNPNMSLSYLLARGIVACAIPDHPLADQWVAPALLRAKIWLDEVGPEGEWYESAHYSQVSAFAMTSFAVAAKRAGFEDLFLNENLKRWAMWLAQIYTPRDPLEGRSNRRATPPIGRATAGVPWGLFGLMARATADTDPLYSKQMQWAWAGSDYTTNTANHLGGFESIYMDRSLPATVPDWTSKLFPQMGPVCRNGVGDEHENYLIMHANTGAGVRPSEFGCLAMWFAQGVPIAGAFPGGYKERHQLLMSRVIPRLSWSEGQPWDESRFGCATDVSMGEFSALPRQDYFSVGYELSGWEGGSYGTPVGPVSWPPNDAPARFPIRWRRQMLYIQDDQPSGPNYLLLRDSVTGAAPTLWQMWTISEKIGTLAEVRNREVFLADMPGASAVPARRLDGSRFTAVGRFDVDVEYFIAAPQKSARWTMRWGQKYVDYSVQGQDYRDLLQLRLDGDGDYFVCMFPRHRDQGVPQFTALGDGTVIRVTGDFGTDHCFLPGKSTEVAIGDVFFKGTAASVQHRNGAKILAIGGAGEVRDGQWGLTAPQAASLRIESDRLVIHLPFDRKQGGEATIRVLGRWELADKTVEARLTESQGVYHLNLASGVTSAKLVPVSTER